MVWNGVDEGLGEVHAHFHRPVKDARPPKAAIWRIDWQNGKEACCCCGRQLECVRERPA